MHLESVLQLGVSRYPFRRRVIDEVSYAQT